MLRLNRYRITLKPRLIEEFSFLSKIFHQTAPFPLRSALNSSPRMPSTIQSGQKIARALLHIANGDGKGVAASKAGLNPATLKPPSLTKASANPIVRSLSTSSPLDLVAQIDGRKVSLREAISRAITAALVTVYELGDKRDKTRDERAQMADAYRAIEFGKSMGLFKEPHITPLPAEVQRQDGEPVVTGPEPYTEEWAATHGWWEQPCDAHDPLDSRSNPAKLAKLPDAKPPNEP